MLRCQLRIHQHTAIGVDSHVSHDHRRRSAGRCQLTSSEDCHIATLQRPRDHRLGTIPNTDITSSEDNTSRYCQVGGISNFDRVKCVAAFKKWRFRTRIAEVVHNQATRRLSRRLREDGARPSVFIAGTATSGKITRKRLVPAIDGDSTPGTAPALTMDMSTRAAVTTIGRDQSRTRQRPRRHVDASA